MKQDINKKNISRRSFIFGGGAVLATAGFALAGCNSKKVTNDPKWNGDIIANISYETTDLCPIGASNALTLSCAWHTYEGLYNIDYHDYSIYNGLAAKEPEKIDDLTYQVVLRDEAKYSDGSLVKPEDVVRSFELNMQDTTYSQFLSFIKTVRVVDKKTVEFSLNYPYRSLLKTRLSLVKIIPSNATKDSLKTLTLGSGPWVIEKFNKQDKIVEFKRNPYFQGKFETNANYMKWNINLDDNSSKDQIVNKETLVTEVFKNDNCDQIRKAGAKVDYDQAFICAFVCFNTRKIPFNNYRLRRAFYYCLDIPKMIDEVFDGHATVASSLLPKNHKNYNKSKFAYDHNIDKVNDLIKDENTDFDDIKILINSNWVKDLAPYIKNDVKASGHDCTIDVKSIDWKSLSTDKGMNDYDLLISPGDPTIFTNDPDLIMSYWYGDNDWMNKISAWKLTDPRRWTELNNKMQKARESTNATTQQQIWNECLDIITEQCPIIPLFHREKGTGYWADKLNNFKPTPTTGLFMPGVSVG